MSGVRSALQVQRAFFRIGWLGVVSYPAFIITRQFGVFGTMVMYSFVSDLVPGLDKIGGDYFTYVVLGLLTVGLLDAGLTGFGLQVQEEIQTGRLEGYLVEPVRWSMLPFGMVQFALVFRVVNTLFAALLALVLGLDINLAGLVPAIVFIALGVAVTLSIGLVAASIRILSKRSDPVLQIYQILATLFAGTFFSIDQLPDWLRPISYIIPHTYVIAGVRRLLMPDGSDIAGPDIWVAVLVLLGWCVVFYPFALRLYNGIMQRGRELGVLAGY